MIATTIISSIRVKPREEETFMTEYSPLTIAIAATPLLPKLSSICANDAAQPQRQELPKRGRIGRQHGEIAANCDTKGPVWALWSINSAIEFAGA